MADLKKSKKDFNILFLWNGNWMRTDKHLKEVMYADSADVLIMQETRDYNAGAVAYIIKKEFAKYLISKVFPIKYAVDIFIGDHVHKGNHYTLLMDYRKRDKCYVSPLLNLKCAGEFGTGDTTATDRGKKELQVDSKVRKTCKMIWKGKSLTREPIRKTQRKSGRKRTSRTTRRKSSRKFRKSRKETNLNGGGDGLSPETIVQKLVKTEIEDHFSKPDWYIMTGNPPSIHATGIRTHQPFTADELVPILTKLYKSYEERLADKPIKNLPRFDPAGGLDYSMSLDEMKNALTERLRIMRAKKQILTEEEFSKLDPKMWRKTGLERIWGAEYLEKKFKEEGRENWRVTDYIIVVKRLDDIQLELDKSVCWPRLVDIRDASIYSKIIDGDDATREKMGEVGHLFTDYSGEGNIRKTADDKYYVLDVEYKSFWDGQPEEKIVKRNDVLAFCPYLKRRFNLVNKLDETDNELFLKVSLKSNNK